ncbi:MAG: hypothetical protein WB511_00210 [Nitrososphaeraceae archaeon]
MLLEIPLRLSISIEIGETISKEINLSHPIGSKDFEITAPKRSKDFEITAPKRSKKPKKLS